MSPTNSKKLFLILSLIFSLFISACSNVENTTQREILGNPDASVTLQIYSDLECPACSKASNFLDVLLEKYPVKIKITYHHFPLESIHPYAFEAAVAAECAGQQESFWKYVKYAYKFQSQLDTISLKKHALNLGLDTEKFNACLDSNATADIVKADLKDALAKGLKGTPSFAINGEMLEFGIGQDGIIAAIDQALAQK